MKDMKNNIAVIHAMAPVAHTATKADCPIVDLQGANSATVIVNTGAIAGDGLYVVSLMHGDAADLAGAVAVTDADLLGTFPSALAAATAYNVGYIGGKRYMRVVITKTSGTSIVAGAVVVKGHLAIAPAV